MAANAAGGDETADRQPDQLDAGPADVDRRERYVLYCLSRHGRMALRDLAEEVSVWETGERLPDISPAESRERYLALYHTHAPRLERAGLVEYCQERDVLGLADAALGVACRKPPRPNAADSPVQSPGKP